MARLVLQSGAMRNILSALLFSVVTVSCTGSADVQYSGGVAVDAQPDLVEAAPGVQVVADYDTPVFYSSGLYWRFDNGGWYSSNVYTGGWSYAASPPSVVLSIDRPEHFVHYRPTGYVARHRPAPQREFHPAPRAAVRAEVHAEPRAEVRAEPRAEVHAEPRAEVHAEPRAEVHTAPRTEREVHATPAKPTKKPVEHHN